MAPTETPKTHSGYYTTKEAMDFMRELNKYPTTGNEPRWCNAKTGKRVSIGAWSNEF